MAKSARCWTRILASSRMSRWPIDARPFHSSLQSRCMSSAKAQDEDSITSGDDEGSQDSLKRRESSVYQRLSDYEEEILANPYHRILASPLRRCIYTRNVLPKDLLIQLKPVFVTPEALQSQAEDTAEIHSAPAQRLPRPSPRSGMPEFFVPDGILHPKWNPKKPGRGAWVTANRKILGQAITAKATPLQNLSSWATMPPRLEEMITYQLQTRVLQEAHVLHHLQSSSHELIREQSLGRKVKPLMLLDWESMQAPSADGIDKQDVGLPLRFYLSELLDEEQQVPELRRLIKEVFFPSTSQTTATVDGRQQDVLTIPARAVFGPLAVALWRLRHWQQS